MPENSIFVDSAAWFGLFIKNDQHHQEATEFWSYLKSQQWAIFTSNFIFDETLTLTVARTNKSTAIKLGEFLLADNNTLTITSILPEDEQTAWKLFQKFPKLVSFTDCTCWALMKRFHIKQVFTFDQHFAMAGFEVLPAL